MNLPQKIDSAVVPAKPYEPIVYQPGMRVEQGIYLGMPEDVYFGTHAISNSGLKTFAEAPAKYRFGEHKRTRSLALGKLWHTALLEPHELENRYCVTELKRFDERMKAYQEEVQRAEGRELIKTDEWEEMLQMCASIAGQGGSLPAVLLHPQLHTELSFFWWDHPAGVFCRARADIAILEHALVGDTKSCQDASDDFNYAVRDWKYHYQNAFYKRGLRKLGYPIDDFVFFAIEKKKPFLYRPWVIPRDATEDAERKILILLDRYRECLDTGIWPGYPEEIGTIEYPESWLNKEKS
jgi:hypothetical protein